MKLENIIIENYRQFDTAELAFDQGITILAGLIIVVKLRLSI